MPYADSGGVRIYYEIVGQGPPLVLHHGLMQTLKRWYVCHYVEALQAEHQVILIDPRGHGGSDKPHETADYELDLRVADVLCVINQLGLDKVTFWAYSDGGRVAFGLAKYAPQRVTALIIGGHPPYECVIPDFVKLNGEDPEECIRKMLIGFSADPAKLQPERFKALMANDFRAIAAAQRDEPSLEEVLPRMTMPCLVYAGEADMFFADIQRSVQSMPNVTFFSLPGADHPKAFWDSKAVIPRALEFLRSLGTEATPALETRSA